MKTLKSVIRTAVVLIAAIVTFAAASGTSGATPATTHLDVSGKRFYNACSGEYVTIVSGTLHILADSRTDGSGGVHVTIRGNAQDVIASGETTGITYHFAGDWWGEGNGRADGSAFVVQLVEVHNMISEGPTANVIVHIVDHVTVDANGRTTIALDSFSSECRG